MSKADRSGTRKERNHFRKRSQKLGHYFIVTDTEETEQKYIYGLRDSIPLQIKNNLVIKVVKTRTIDLVDKAISLASQQAQYSEIWIVFDRDQVKDFDNIVKDALSKDVKVGWSNPCIEIWFHAYFGSMPVSTESVKCCNDFKKEFSQKTKQQYSKADKEIYMRLNKYGNENQAIEFAEQRLKQRIKENSDEPSQMFACTTVHKLVKDIKDKAGL